MSARGALTACPQRCPLSPPPAEPKVRISALQSGSLPQTDRLACYVTGFYPLEIEVKWFQNGQEETERVVSTDVIQNGDWTYQVLVVLETSPRHGDSYVCQVEHTSLQQPITQRWGKAPSPCPDVGGVGAWPSEPKFLFLSLQSPRGM